MTMKTPPDRYAFADTSCRAQSVADRRQAIQTPFSKTLCLLNGEKRSAGRQRRIRCLHGRDKEEGQPANHAVHLRIGAGLDDHRQLAHLLIA